MEINVALVGNPNVGKTSIFNALTGLNQKVGNYPGITVDKKTGKTKLNDQITARIIDLPGTYSILPKSKDEEVVLNTLLDKSDALYPDVVVVIAEVENLKRNLLVFTQIKDLGFKTVLAINMADQMDKHGISIDVDALARALDTNAILISSKTGEGISELKSILTNQDLLKSGKILAFDEINSVFAKNNDQELFPYQKWIVSTPENLNINESEHKRQQQKETIKRYQYITQALKNSYTKDSSKANTLRAKADRILTHPIWGYAIFFGIMLLIFQAIFSWSSIPMDWIDEQFSNLSSWLAGVLPEGKLSQLITEGIIPGIGGVVIFIPQIAILFMFIAILEESGYMSRVVFLMDKIMRPFGLSGKSVVPLISGVACAIPAIMSARNIENTKERLITMLVTPFATCSARIPVYVIIISLVIPEQNVWGFISLQGLVMTLMYFLGFLAALIGAILLKKLINSTEKSYLVIEMPQYRWPMVKNVASTMLEKTKAFIEGAGKIILALSILLWFLGSHGPSSTFGNAEEIVKTEFKNLEGDELEDEIQGYKLRNSYIGIAGNAIQPIFAPLGYDWKISVAVLTSFAAREVFVGNLATLYNIGSHGEEETRVIERMKAELRPNGNPMFDLPTGVSILLFYAFAMQCISTIGIMRRETNSWKWTLLQVIFMTGLAYISAFAAYNFFQ